MGEAEGTGETPGLALGIAAAEALGIADGEAARTANGQAVRTAASRIARDGRTIEPMIGRRARTLHAP